MNHGKENHVSVPYFDGDGDIARPAFSRLSASCGLASSPQDAGGLHSPAHPQRRLDRPASILPLTTFCKMLSSLSSSGCIRRGILRELPCRGSSEFLVVRRCFAYANLAKTDVATTRRFGIFFFSSPLRHKRFSPRLCKCPSLQVRDTLPFNPLMRNFKRNQDF